MELAHCVPTRKTVKIGTVSYQNCKNDGDSYKSFSWPQVLASCKNSWGCHCFFCHSTHRVKCSAFIVLYFRVDMIGDYPHRVFFVFWLYLLTLLRSPLKKKKKLQKQGMEISSLNALLSWKWKRIIVSIVDKPKRKSCRPFQFSFWRFPLPFDYQHVRVLPQHKGGWT